MKKFIAMVGGILASFVALFSVGCSGGSCGNCNAVYCSACVD